MPDAKAGRAAAILEFVDDRGMLWRVTERDARLDPGALRESCLIFASADAIRRVWFYPDDWRQLDPDALSRLSWAR